METVDAWMPTAPTIPSEWTDEAKCKDQPTEFFFPETRGGPMPHTRAQFCEGCPVRIQCGAAAIVEELIVSSGGHYVYGIRGGMSPSVRIDIMTALRARPAA